MSDKTLTWIFIILGLTCPVLAGVFMIGVWIYEALH